MIRLVAFLVIGGLLCGLLWGAAGAVRGAARTAGRSAARMVRPPTRKPSGYQWERRTDQVARRVKGLAGPSEDRETIIRFIETRQDVEAYVEPKTMVHPLSVVLVAADGEWTRLQLASDAFIRDLARKRHLPIHDAAKVGYPDRMRRYKRGGPKPPDEPSQS